VHARSIWNKEIVWPPYKGEALELTLGEEGVVVELKARWLSAMLM
jgi:hypothetical protein